MQKEINGRTLDIQVREDLIVSGINVDIAIVEEIFTENVYQVGEDDIKDKIVLDLGANIGAFSLYAAALGAKKVYAFEPNPNNYAVLLNNIAINGFEEIIYPIKKAVSDSEKVQMIGEGGCSREEMTGFLVGSDAVIDEKAKYGERIEAEAMNLKDIITMIIRMHPGIGVLKSDIEWSEYYSFSTIDKEMMDWIDYLTMEFHGTGQRVFGIMFANLTQSFNLHTFGSFDRGGMLYGRRY